MSDVRNARRSPRQVFTTIYERRGWGGADGSRFFSGSGSHTRSLVDPYVALMVDELASRGGNETVVDLGCGDFAIGSRLVEHCGAYVGVDVVPALIEHHRSQFASDRVSFACLDITTDELPDGDVCILRQVLQHLSNDEIAAIVPKLRKYRVAYVTEHYPPAGDRPIKNRDIVHGARVRAERNSGVYLDAAPFDVPGRSLQLLLETAWDGRGTIRTYRITFDPGGPDRRRPR